MSEPFHLPSVKMEHKQLAECPACSIQDLRKEKQACYGKLPISNHPEASQNEVAASLPERRWIIKGELCGEERRGKANDMRETSAEQLLLKDGTGSIACQVTTKGPLVLNKEIVCLSWVLQNCDFTGYPYLEINDWMLANDLPEEDAVPVITAADAKILLYNRSKHGVKQVNVFGKITALTEIFMVNSDALFIVILEPHLPIVIKEKRYLHWQGLLVPHRTYLFTGLKLATLSKGKPNESTVLVPWKDALVGESCYINHKLTTLQELCEEHNCNPGNLDSHVSEIGFPELVLYEGVITDVSKLSSGKLVLDNHIFVNFSSIGTPNRFQFLRPGALLTVFNSHLIHKRQGSAVRICNCLYSCMKVKHFPLHHDKAKVYDYGANILWHLTVQYSLSHQQMEQVSRCYEALQKKLLPQYNMVTCNEVLRAIISQQLGKKKRVFLDEVLHPQHAACNISTVSEEKMWSVTKVKDLSVLYQTEKPHARTSSGLYWNYDIICSDSLSLHQVLIGWLKGNRETGKLEFCDSTGQLACVIAADSKGRRHECALPDCVLPYSSFAITPQGSITCPYPQTWLLGSLVMVKKFMLVQESFHPDTSSQQDSQAGQPLHRFYLQFSMLDAIILSTKKVYVKEILHQGIMANASTVISKPLGENYGKACKKLKPDSNDLNQTFFVSQLLLITAKDSPVVLNRFINEPQLQFYADGCFIGEPNIYQVCDKDFKKCAILTKSSPSVPERRHVALMFRGSQVALYPVIHPQCAYRLIYLNTNDVSPFQANIRSKQLHRALQKQAVEDYITVREDAVLVRVSSGSVTDDVHPLLKMLHGMTEQERDWLHEVRNKLRNLNRLLEVYSVNQVMEKRAAEARNELVSCEGIIQDKSFYKNAAAKHRCEHQGNAADCYTCRLRLWNERFDVSVPMNYYQKLTLGDMDSGITLQVIAGLHDLSYPLALVPGTRIRLYKLEQHSDAGSYYCSITKSSDISIVSVNNEHTRPREEMSSHYADMEIMPATYLVELLAPSGEGSHYLCHCRITEVHQVVLQLVCVNCSMNIEVAQAQCPTCNSPSAPRVKAYAVAIVDDGTYTARVYCNLAETVAQLLALTDPEWQEMKLHIQQNGPAHYDLFCKSEEEPLETVIKELCRSNVVCRRVSLVAQKRYFKNKSTLYQKRTVKTQGKQLETHCLPSLHLEALAILPLDELHCINRLLGNLK